MVDMGIRGVSVVVPRALAAVTTLVVALALTGCGGDSGPSPDPVAASLASGLASVSASFASDASNSPASAIFQGTGVAAAVYTVSLSWNPSTSPNVTGYNIYRRTGTSGGYTKINTAVNSATSYVDTSVTNGLTYYYETTAVNSSGEESAPSAAVQAVIPAP